MAEMRVERRIEAPASRVWNIITDLDRSPRVVSAIESVEVLTDQPFGVGTEWRETRTMFGKRSTETMRVVEVTDGSSYVVESEATGAVYRSVMSVAPEGDESCSLSMSFSADATSSISKVFSSTIGKLFEGGTRKALEQDLADIAAVAESRSEGD